MWHMKDNGQGYPFCKILFLLCALFKSDKVKGIVKKKSIVDWNLHKICKIKKKTIHHENIIIFGITRFNIRIKSNTTRAKT